LPTGIFDANGVGVSASGNRLAAGNNSGYILVSTNLAATWSVTNHFGGTFRTIAVSADGSTLGTVSGGSTA